MSNLFAVIGKINCSLRGVPDNIAEDSFFADFSPCRQMGTLEEAQEVKKMLDTKYAEDYSYRVVQITWID